MKQTNVIKMLGVFSLVAATSAHADLNYNFNADAEGFANVSWQAANPVGWAGGSTVKQAHTAGGWQMLLTKEFSWGAGGGSANQQLEMQALANLGDSAHLSFDIMIDGLSFPAGSSAWFQFNVVGNSDGTAGWTQKENLFTVSSWHNADDSTLISMHIDQPFSYFGWQPGDSWFQFYTGSNSDGAAVNFYIDNVSAYAVVPEPTTLTLAGLGCVALLMARRRN